MENKQLNDVASVLARLDKSLNKNKNKNKSSYKEANEARKKAVMKFHEGRNQIAFISPKGKKDPFFEWGYHTGLQEVSYYSVPCDKFNKGEKCIICDLVETLKQDWEKNKHLWMPIQQKIEVYASVICMDSEETIAEGPKWVKLSKTIMDIIYNWLENLESDELPLYDEQEPQKLVVTYDAEALPKDKYKVDKKNMKPFSDSQLSEWKETLIPITNFMFSKSQDEISKIVDEYLQRIEDMVNEAEEKDNMANESKQKTNKKIVHEDEGEEEEERSSSKKNNKKDVEDDPDEIFNSTRKSRLDSLKS